MMNASLGPVGQEIRARLTAALSPTHLAVSDDSAQHAGHAGHDSAGESHFSVELVADAFAGQSRVARQRMVTYALADLLRDKVHALAIKARAPGE
jgi:BolA family transcriptional regulator, general stress-responsive regulator